MGRFTITIRTAGALGVLVSALSIGVAGMAADTADSLTAIYRQRLDNDMQALDRRYEEFRRELREEYTALIQEKDANHNIIFERVRELKADREKALDVFNTEKAKFEDSMRKANISSDDKRYIDAATPLGEEERQINRTFDNSLASFQQLYQLNGKRYNELLTIHTVREGLEQNRYREERDIMDDKARNDMLAAREGLTEAEKWEIALRAATTEELRREGNENYQAQLNALDECRDLVNSRIKAQQDYLTEHEGIMTDLASVNLTAADRAEYADRLDKLNDRKNADERRYQNDMRYIEETLSYRLTRNDELAGLESERREVGMAWTQLDGKYREQRMVLDNRLKDAGITADARRTVEQQVANLKNRHDDNKKTYDNAIRNLGERRKLTERSLADYAAYLKDRNDIRATIAMSPMNQENLEKFRGEISVLEEKRINQERDIRNQMLSLGSAMPAAFRFPAVPMDGMERRKDRIIGRLEYMKDTIDARWQREQNNLNSSFKALDERLAAPGLTDAQKQAITTEKDALQHRLTTAQQRYNQTVRKLDERREAEEQRLAARAHYIAQRNELEKSLDPTLAQYPDIQQYEKQLADLDSKFSAEEREYRTSQRPLAALFAGAHGDPEWQDKAESDWNRGMEQIGVTQAAATTASDASRSTDVAMGGPSGQTDSSSSSSSRASPAVGSMTAPSTVAGNPPVSVSDATDMATAASATDRRSVEGEEPNVWQSVKEAIVDTYNDAVHYLTD